MNKEEQIESWLNGSLKGQELEDFKRSDVYNKILKIERTAQLFKAPLFDDSSSLASIESAKRIKNSKKRISTFYKYTGIAALFIVGLFISFQWIFNSSVSIETASNQEEIIELPDHSKVYLNSNSKLTYNTFNFESNRNLKLIGEAFFEVEKGEKFTVETPNSKIEVLGTSFNIKSRDDFSQVDCYTGKVRVTDYQNNEAILTKNQRFANYDGDFSTSKFPNSNPVWIGKHKSSFSKTPLHVVLNELAIQYQVEINSSAIDSSVDFSGSFVHDNLDEALNSIVLPLQISYKIKENQVTLQKD